MKGSSGTIDSSRIDDRLFHLVFESPDHLVFYRHLYRQEERVFLFPLRALGEKPKSEVGDMLGPLPPLTIVGIGKIELATCVPRRTLIAMGWNPTGVFDHACQVQQIPRHEGCVAIREIVFRTA